MIQDPNIHYLDNAATTMVAPEVADVIDKAMRCLLYTSDAADE